MCSLVLPAVGTLVILIIIVIKLISQFCVADTWYLNGISFASEFAFGM